MIINVQNIKEGHSSLIQDTRLDSVKTDLPEFRDKIRCKVEIDRSGPTLYVHVWFEGAFELECSRCLKQFSLPITGETRIIIQEAAGKHGKAEENESVDFYFDTRHSEIDISPAIFDEIMTALPLKPLCEDQCKGIQINDPDIHVDSNQSKKNEEVDPRWEALKKLKK
jgi:uncharacterized protein